MSSEAIQAEDAAPSYRPGSDQREVPPGHKRADMGVIPADWTRSTIGEIATIYNGATPSTQVAHYWNGDIPWCVPTDITADDGKYLHSTERRLTQAGLDSCAAKLLPVGTLLLCSRATIGEVKIATTAVCTNQGFKALVCHDDVSHEFVYYLLLTLKPRMVERASGSTFLEIGKRDLASIPIALPGETEQRAIAEALSDVDGLLGALEALIAKKRAIKQAAMQQLLTGKTRLPGFSGEWETKRLGDIAHIKTGSRNNEDKVKGGHYPFFVRSEFVERIDTFSYDCEAILVPGEGRIGEIFHYIQGRFDVHQRVYAITRFAPEVSGRFVYFYMAMAFGTWAMQNTVKATVDSLRLPTFQNFAMSVPPTVEEQTAIATVLSDMDAEIAALEARRDKIRAIKQGMMQQLLTGRVRLVQINGSSGSDSPGHAGKRAKGCAP